MKKQKICAYRWSLLMVDVRAYGCPLFLLRHFFPTEQLSRLIKLFRPYAVTSFPHDTEDFTAAQLDHQLEADQLGTEKKVRQTTMRTQKLRVTVTELFDCRHSLIRS